MKSYTDLEQSKKLAEILPIESADMNWTPCDNGKKEYYKAVNERISTNFEKKYHIPCWSLAALLDVMPSVSLDSSDDHHYRLYCKDRFSEWHDNPIDACLEMIELLHKENLI